MKAKDALILRGPYGDAADGSFISHAEHLPDEEYSRVLDNIVIGCVDVVVCHGGELLLGKRTRYPVPDWWLMGGRMRPGETLRGAASRLIERELGIGIHPDRFQPFMTSEHVYHHRAQPPEDHGFHALAVTLYVGLTGDEAEKIRHDDEYSELKWHSLALVGGGVHSGFYEYVVDCARAVLFLKGD